MSAPRDDQGLQEKSKLERAGGEAIKRPLEESIITEDVPANDIDVDTPEVTSVRAKIDIVEPDSDSDADVGAADTSDTDTADSAGLILDPVEAAVLDVVLATPGIGVRGLRAAVRYMVRRRHSVVREAVERLAGRRLIQIQQLSANRRQYWPCKIAMGLSRGARERTGQGEPKITPWHDGRTPTEIGARSQTGMPQAEAGTGAPMSVPANVPGQILEQYHRVPSSELSSGHTASPLDATEQKVGVFVASVPQGVSGVKDEYYQRAPIRAQGGGTLEAAKAELQSVPRQNNEENHIGAHKDNASELNDSCSVASFDGKTEQFHSGAHENTHEAQPGAHSIASTRGTLPQPGAHSNVIPFAAPKTSNAPTRTPRRASFEVGSEVEVGERLARWLTPDGGVRPVYNEDAVYVYRPQSGLWEVMENHDLSALTQGFDQSPIGASGTKKKLRLSDGMVHGAIRLFKDRVYKKRFFADAVRGLSFCNGFVSVDKEGVHMHAHSPDFRMRRGYEFAIDLDARPTRWLQVLDEIFRDDADRLERVALIGEFFGACLLGIAPRYHKCLFLKSDGGTGRSTIGEIMTECMPPPKEISVKGLSPDQFQEDHYRALLAGVHLNFVHELPKTSLLETSFFKQLITGEIVIACQKYQKPFEFRPIAGHAFLGQDLPQTGDLSYAFWSRIIALFFTRKFRDTRDDNVNLSAQILAAERPAIIVWLLQNAVRLIRQERYTIPASHEALAAEWRRESDSVAAFCFETRVLADGDYPSEKGHNWVSAEVLYTAYREWAGSMGAKAVGHTTFARRMTDLGLAPVRNGVARHYPVRKRAPDDRDRPDALTGIKQRRSLKLTDFSSGTH